MALRDQIQKIALAFPAYGYRRITRELGRRGWAVNHKRVLRLMRQDNLLCLRRKSFLRTTDSGHSLPVFANVAATLAVTGMNQLWVLTSVSGTDLRLLWCPEMRHPCPRRPTTESPRVLDDGIVRGLRPRNHAHPAVDADGR
jgi:transposase InsO family protein